MTKYTRLTGKVFGSSATATGDDPEIGQFGSALAGTYNGTTDVATIQSLPAWQKGFIGCVTPNTQFPPLPEMTGFGKVLSQQICYLLQQGVPEYDSGTTYYNGNWCAYNKNLYTAKADGFSNVAPTDTTKWDKFTGGFSRNYGEIVTSSLPITDATLHLADGSLLNNTDYPEFVSYVANLYNTEFPDMYLYAWYLDEASTAVYTTKEVPEIGDSVYLEYPNTTFGTVHSVAPNQYISVLPNTPVPSIYVQFLRDSSRDIVYTTGRLKVFTTEADWQATYTTYGECGKYVYNSSANTVRIPLYNSYFTNTVNPQKLGDLTEASLPNIKGTGILNDDVGFCSGALYDSGSVQTTNSEPGGSSSHLINFSAHLSNSIYKDSATTVNTQSIKQLVYIVVGK